MVESDSSQSGEYKKFRQISRDRLLVEMVRSTKEGDSKSSWKVLIMDKITVKVMTYSCKMAHITEEGISLVEDLFKRRQPMSSMDAIYFIQPLKENVIMFLSDMSGRCPLYKKAYVFFSSPVPKELVTHIKNDTSVLPRIAALREMNLEYFAIDSQGFITDQERALEQLFRQNAENSRNYEACLNTMATRFATVFASLRELPLVRYRAAKSSLNTLSTTSHHDIVPTKFATAVWNCVSKYKSSISDFPQNETCQLLILDRSIDQIAPIIHEWTYDAMCHDVLNMEGSKYIYEATNKAGKTEKKEMLLEDHDPVWLELRHAHIADASERLHEKMTNFVSKNKAAQIQKDCRDESEISTRDLQKVVQALPQYNDQIEKLSLHVEIAGKINKLIKDLGLRELGKLEQNLVFGDAGTKEVINLLRTSQVSTPEHKLRLLMIYAATNPDKFEGDKGSKLMQLARLPPEDITVVNNMMYLEGSNIKKTTGSGFSLKFDTKKKNNAARKERTDEEETWQLSRFYPVVEELIEKLSKGELSSTEYPFVNQPSCTGNENNHQTASSNRSSQNSVPHSMRSRRTTARAQVSDDGSSRDFKRMGQRIFVFIIGGATRSELRVAHKLTTKLRREVILGSSSLDDPPQFIKKLRQLNAQETAREDDHQFYI